MREIKFRAWDGSQMEMPRWNLSDYIEGMICRCGEGNLMQYTGLKDKNGVEIYEGDILCFDWRMQESNKLVADDCENIKGVVSFCTAKFIVRYFNNAMLFDLSEINQLTHERFWRSCNDYYKMTDFKVVGNIYENPELLEK